MTSVDHKPSIPQYKMKRLGGILAFGWFLIILGVVKAGTVAYPGRSALLSYNPARGEFPVQSVFGRGYFNYIDENGSSRIVILEPNPLWGVRVSGNGQSQIEIGRNVDLEQIKEAQKINLATESKDVRKQEKLKPIKEFDFNPFVDSLEQKFVFPQNLPLPDNLRLGLESISTAAEVPRDGQIYFYQPAPSALKVATTQGFGQPLKPLNFNPGNPFLPPNSGLVFPNPSPPIIAGVTEPMPPSTGLQLPVNSGQVFLNPSPPINPQKPATESPIISMLGPGTTLPTLSTVFPNPPAPTASQGVFPNPKPVTTLPTPSTVIQNPPAPTVSQGGFPNPTPSGNPFLLPANNIKEKPSPPKQPTTSVRPPQFNADKKNPFLPSSGIRNDLQPDLKYLPPSSTPLPDNQSPSVLIQDSDQMAAASPEQVKDTPEVEQAKRDHFLAHELAIARLEMARQQEDANSDHRDESSLSLNYDSFSADLASSQAVTSGPSPLASADQTKLPCAASDAVPPVPVF